MQSTIILMFYFSTDCCLVFVLIDNDCDIEFERSISEWYWMKANVKNQNA